VCADTWALRICRSHVYSGTFKDRRLSELIGKTFAYAYATVQGCRLFVFVIDMLFRDQGAGGDRSNGQGEAFL
jgi:hypothetical protein